MFLTALLCMTGGVMVCQAKRPLSSYSTQSYNWGLITSMVNFGRCQRTSIFTYSAGNTSFFIDTCHSFCQCFVPLSNFVSLLYLKKVNPSVTLLHKNLPWTLIIIYLTDEEINDVADLIDEYTRITTLRKPEIVKADVYKRQRQNCSQVWERFSITRPIFITGKQENTVTFWISSWD